MVYNRTMPKRLRTTPRDINQLGKVIVDLTTGEIEPEEIPEKNPHTLLHWANLAAQKVERNEQGI